MARPAKPLEQEKIQKITMKKVIVNILVAVFVMAVCIACGGGTRVTESNLVGIWQSDEGSIEFFNDQTGIIRGDLMETGNPMSLGIRWQLRGDNRLQVEMEFLGMTITEVFDIELSDRGRVLTTRDSEGYKEVYRRQ